MIEILSTSFSGPLPGSIWHEYLHQMPKSIQDRVEKYYRWQDRHSFLLGRMLLRRGLIRYGYDATILENISKTSCGKPYLEEGIDFNISHSGNRVVCALSPDSRLGIDIEAVRNIDYDGFQNCFTEKEWSQIGKSPDPQRVFFQCWTRKESVIKADGRGLYIPLQDICTVNDAVYYNKELWYLHNISAEYDYPSCLATNTFRAEIRLLSLNFMNLDK